MNSIFLSLLYCIIFSVWPICTSIILTASSLETDHSNPIYSIHLMCLSLSIKSVPSDSLSDSLQFYAGVIQLKSILSVWDFMAFQPKIDKIEGEMRGRAQKKKEKKKVLVSDSGIFSNLLA